MVSNLPDSKRRYKTREILEYFFTRGNEEISIKRIATELRMDQKIVGSIASRLAARGIITRRSRGVYIYKQERVLVSTVEKILSKLGTTVKRTFGGPIAEKIGLSEIEDRRSMAGLEDALCRMRKIIGVRGATNLLKLVARKVANTSEYRYILAKLDITD